jgi:hypothetical protein
MIEKMIQFRHQTLFMSVATTAEEIKRLENLARDVKHCCSICRKTGLWVASERGFEGGFVLVTTLNKSIELSIREQGALFIAGISLKLIQDSKHVCAELYQEDIMMQLQDVLTR